MNCIVRAYDCRVIPASVADRHFPLVKSKRKGEKGRKGREMRRGKVLESEVMAVMTVVS
jgi:hypothetical protein